MDGSECLIKPEKVHNHSHNSKTLGEHPELTSPGGLKFRSDSGWLIGG